MYHEQNSSNRLCFQVFLNKFKNLINVFLYVGGHVATEVFRRTKLSFMELADN